MATALIDFDKVASKYQAVVAASKKAGTHAQDAKIIDPKVMADLEKLVKASLQHTSLFEKEAERRHKIGKDLLTQMAALMKKAGKNVTDETLSGLTILQKALNDQNRVLKTLSADMMEALVQFRGGWPQTYKALVFDPAPVEALQSLRMKSINAGKEANALAQRIEEYAERGADYMKLAVKLHRVASGEGRDRDDWKDFEEISNDVKSIEEKFDQLHRKAEGAFQRIVDLDAKVKPEPKALSTYESILISGRAEAKSARGQVKTLEMKIEGFQKAAKKADATYKQAVVYTMKEVNVTVKKIETKAKALDKLESLADKAFAKILKLK